MNTQLFNRTTRSVSLTQVGFQFLPDAQQMLNLYYHSLEWISTDDAFVCVMRNNHPLALACKKRRRKSVSSKDMWPYRQIIDIPPYLLKHVFSRGHHIVPVNDELDNIICATTSEAYNLALAGAGFALIPQHLTLPHKELIFLPWEESPHAPMGIYYHQQGSMDKNSAIYKFITLARECAKEAMPCNKQ